MTKTAVKEKTRTLFGEVEPDNKNRQVAAKPDKIGAASKAVAVRSGKGDAETPPANMMAVIARAAADPNVNPDKMRQLLDMQIEIAREEARMAFTSDFIALQDVLPVIDRDGKIDHGQGKQKSGYSTYPNLMKVCKPLMRANGFALASWVEPSPDLTRILVVSQLDHVRGHFRKSVFPLGAETSGSKNNIQGWGSSQSYGMRYNAIGLLNIVSQAPQDRDRDGAEPPKGKAKAERLSAEDLKKLSSAIEFCGVGENGFCKHYKIAKVEELPPELFNEAMKACQDYAAKNSQDSHKMKKPAPKKKPERKTTFEIVDVEQGSPAWFEARLGIPTASMFSVMMASGKDDDASKTRTDYLYELAGENFFGNTVERFSTHAMQRGRDMEDDAREQYARTRFGAKLTRVGFVKNAGLMKYAVVGASPDSLVEDGGRRGGLEIKTMMPKLMIRRLLAGATLPPEHRAQVHGNVWVCEAEFWDFKIYWPGMPPFVVRVERDDVFIRQISDECERFSYDLKMLVERLRKMGSLVAMIAQHKMRPVLFTWDDERMVPEPRMLALCQRQFVVGEKYPLEVVQPRNMNQHKAYFAQLHEAWLNLREDLTERFKTEDHLRAWALVQCGFCKETDYPCDSEKDAVFIAKIIRARSSYAVIKRSGDVVKVFDPESQAVYGPDAMPAERFKDSSKAVLDLVATLARTTPGDLRRNAGRSA